MEFEGTGCSIQQPPSTSRNFHLLLSHWHQLIGIPKKNRDVKTVWHTFCQKHCYAAQSQMKKPEQKPLLLYQNFDWLCCPSQHGTHDRSLHLVPIFHVNYTDTGHTILFLFLQHIILMLQFCQIISEPGSRYSAKRLYLLMLSGGIEQISPTDLKKTNKS